MIVVVEDDPAVRRSLQMLLLAQGHKVRAYPSGDALLADADAAQVNCIVADYRLDGMSGIELLERLRGQGQDCPAILITGHVSEELDAKARAAGYAVIFEKPLRQHALVEAVARLAAGRQAS